MSKIIIGKADGKNVSIDLELLLSTRALLTADSGGGKTFALKRIVEQAFGKIQIIIIDPEGEFSPLREKLDFVLVGKGGETPADVRSAALVAQTILKLRASVIVDLYEMKPSERHAYVRAFIDALIEAPKEMRHPCLVIVDEAHIFCPEHGKGESVASESMIGLCTRGRKRLLCPLFATQRLATLSKDASSMLLNRMIGPTFEDINRKRAADVLGIAKDGQKEFYRQIQTLEPGNFFCLGRAISKEMVLVHVGPIETPHGQEARKYEMTPPPAPEKIKELLPKLAELPKEAEAKARTEAEFKREIRELHMKLKVAERAQSAAPASPGKTVTKSDPQQARTIQQLRTALEDAVKIIAKINAVGFEGAEVKPEEISAAIEKAAAEVGRLAGQKIALKRRELESLKAEVNRLLSKLQAKLGDEKINIAVDVVKNEPVTVREPRQVQPRLPRQSVAYAGNGDLSASQIKILSRLAELLECTGKDAVRKEQLAAWTEYSPNSGGYNNYLGSLRSAGLIEYPSGGQVTITDEGRKHAQPGDVPADNSEMLERAKRVLGGSEGRILESLHASYPEIVGKVELAEATGFSANSGGFNNYLGHMRTLGFIEYPQPGKVRASDWLFLEAA